jgi:hypothetical protein
MRQLAKDVRTNKENYVLKVFSQKPFKKDIFPISRGLLILPDE